jgi:flagellar basal body-associated protein FliL
MSSEKVNVIREFGEQILRKKKEDEFDYKEGIIMVEKRIRKEINK